MSPCPPHVRPCQENNVEAEHCSLGEMKPLEPRTDPCVSVSGAQSSDQTRLMGLISHSSHSQYNV